MISTYNFARIFFYLTLILLRSFQQHYCYNETGQSQESEGSSGLISQRGLKKYIHSYSCKPDICLHIHSAESTVRLLNQAGRNNYPYNPEFVGNAGNLI